MSGAMTEFRITTDLGELRKQVIEANFDEVRSWLDENLEPYRNMTVTEDMISTAKGYRASIRKVKDRIEQSRKEAKNAALAAYGEFEAKCKELTGMCDEAVGALDRQVKSFEDAERERKISALRREYDTLASLDPEAGEYCPWETVFDPRWGNKGFDAADAEKTISDALSTTRSDLDMIRELGGDDTAYLLGHYRQCRDLRATLRKQGEIKEAREREESRRKLQEELRENERLKREEAALRAKEAPAVTPTEDAAEEAERVREIDFRVWVTKAQLDMLGAFLRGAGIRYGRVPG